MTTVQRIIELGRGLSFTPSVFSYSRRITSANTEEFQKSSVRAISLVKAYNFFGYDGVVCEIDPLVSLDATGDMGNDELSTDQLKQISRIGSSLEVCSRVTQMVGKGKTDVIAPLYGYSYLRRRYAVSAKDYFTLVDNLTNLARLYLEAGCTCIVINEDTLDQESLEACMSISRLAEMYSAQSLIMVNGPTRLERDLSEKFSFPFVFPQELDLNSKTRCFAIDQFDELSLKASLLQAVQSAKTKPTLVLTKTEIPTDTSPQLLKELVSEIKKIVVEAR